ncbi:MAG: hypothetical protein KJ622_08105 [Alphaproteobacteria bacterium]|nr:hypothetical protein [Alphaproteobacteria bacterium]
MPPDREMAYPAPSRARVVETPARPAFFLQHAGCTHWRPLAVIASSIILLQGCAAGSGEVEAIFVAPDRYRSLACQEIEAEARRVAAQATIVSGIEVKAAATVAQQPQARTPIVWPALFFVNGNGVVVDEFARLSGEFSALKTISAEKSCDLEFKGP